MQSLLTFKDVLYMLRGAYRIFLCKIFGHIPAASPQRMECYCYRCKEEMPHTWGLHLIGNIRKECVYCGHVTELLPEDIDEVFDENIRGPK